MMPPDPSLPEPVRPGPAQTPAELASHYQALLAVASDGIHIMDTKGNLCEYSESFARMLGYAAGEMAGLSAADWDAGFSPAQLRMALEAVTTEPVLVQTRFRRRDGSTYPVEIHARGITLRGRAYVYASARDISDRERVTGEMQGLLAFNRGTLDSIRSHLCVLNAAGEILAVNRAWREFAELNPPVISNVAEGANYLTACADAAGADQATAQAMARGIRAVAQGELVEFNQEYPCHSPAELRWFSGHVTRFEAAGEVRVVVAHTNITERKKHELELLRKNQELEGALAEVGTLQGLLPICCGCKKIRDDKGYWSEVETYISHATGAHFSHGLCPECAQRLYPDYYRPRKGPPNS